MEIIYVSIVVSIIYFLLKLILDKNEEDPTISKKNLKDSVYVGFIVFSVLYIKDYYFSKEFGKANVFTNEPGF